jgi:hypothetical protein
MLRHHFFFSPSQIIGSIVNTWPDFITPTALFSEIKGKKCQKIAKANCILLNSSQKTVWSNLHSHQWSWLSSDSLKVCHSINSNIQAASYFGSDIILGTLHSAYVFYMKIQRFRDIGWVPDMIITSIKGKVPWFILLQIRNAMTKPSRSPSPVHVEKKSEWQVFHMP